MISDPESKAQRYFSVATKTTFVVVIFMFSYSIVKIPVSFLAWSPHQEKSQEAQAAIDHQILAAAVSEIESLTAHTKSFFYLNEFQFIELLATLNDNYSRSPGSVNTPYRPNTGLHSLDASKLLVLATGYGPRSEIQLRNLIASWLQLVPNHYVFGWEYDINYPTFVRMNSTIKGKEERTVNDDLDGHSIGWVMHNQPGHILAKKWFILIDAETWINVPGLLYHLYKYSEGLPIAFGKVDHSRYGINGNLLSELGLILSKEAFWRVTQNLNSTRCPYYHGGTTFNIAACFMQLAILVVNLPKIGKTGLPRIYDALMFYPPFLVEQISYRMSDLRELKGATCVACVHWKSRLPKDCSRNLTTSEASWY